MWATTRYIPAAPVPSTPQVFGPTSGNTVTSTGRLASTIAASRRRLSTRHAGGVERDALMGHQPSPRARIASANERTVALDNGRFEMLTCSIAAARFG